MRLPASVTLLLINDGDTNGGGGTLGPLFQSAESAQRALGLSLQNHLFYHGWLFFEGSGAVGGMTRRQHIKQLSHTREDFPSPSWISAECRSKHTCGPTERCS